MLSEERPPQSAPTLPVQTLAAAEVPPLQVQPAEQPRQDVLSQGESAASNSGTPGGWKAEDHTLRGRIRRVIHRFRVDIFRPGMLLVQRLFNGRIFFNEPLTVDANRHLVSNFTMLHPAEVLDFGDPATDRFLRNCQYIEDGKLPRGNIFVCEVEGARFYPELGLVFDRNWHPLLESILYLARLNNFRRRLHPRNVVKRAGTFSSINHIFHQNNWHWTVDSLAQLHSLERFMDGKPLTLLMPESLRDHQRQNLAILLPENFTVEYVAPEQWLEVDRFILPSYVSSQANGYLPPGYFESLRNRTFTSLNVSPPAKATGRYYISRSRAAHRRVVNEPEIVSLLAAFGFEPIWMEDLNLRQQVELMLQAESIISAHGAGLGCMLYGNDLKVCVLYPEARPAGYFYTMARGLGHQHFQTNADVREDDDFHVDADALRRVILEEMHFIERPLEIPA
jgi:hypothetical protein